MKKNLRAMTAQLAATATVASSPGGLEVVESLYAVWVDGVKRQFP